jgi:hypothetical protein
MSKTELITAEELLVGDNYRELSSNIFRIVKSIHQLPNSYHVPPVGHKIMIVTETTKTSLLKEQPVEILNIIKDGLQK